MNLHFGGTLFKAVRLLLVMPCSERRSYSPWEVLVF